MHTRLYQASPSEMFGDAPPPQSEDKVYLGNLDAIRDWGHARDYVDGMWLMVQQDTPQDFVIGKRVGHTVREFCERAFGHVGLDWRPFVAVDPRYFRPTEVDELRADPTRANTELGWRPKISFERLVTDNGGGGPVRGGDDPR